MSKTKIIKPWMLIVKEFLSEYRTYQEVADALGISRVVLSFWVQGRSRPSVAECYKIEKFTEGRIKAASLLEGHPHHCEFKTLSTLVDELYIQYVQKKMTKAFRVVELVPPAMYQCIQNNSIPSDKFCYFFARVLGKTVRFWQGVKATLEYRKS